ncbi:MAG: Gfo/Idh/MocA family oxidoreductase, partial [Armatimonadetes bacterium]|nr:Gfo/Idh/MocA family oxidoreductase [Armatimonadota bacterium]
MRDFGSDKPVGLALVGCNSSLLYVYGPHSFRVLQGGVLVAVMDVDQKRAECAQQKLGAKRWYTDYEKVLEDDEVEAVILVSPGWCHEPQTVAAAKAAKHVLCEKPMARTIEECDRMIAACDRAGVTLMIAHMKRFNRSFRKVHDMIRNGDIGEVFAVRGLWDEPARWLGEDGTFRSDARSLGGHWHDHGTHMSDLSCWWVGSPVARVNGAIGSIGQYMTMGDDFCIATLVHANGAMSCHQTTTYTFRAWYET